VVQVYQVAVGLELIQVLTVDIQPGKRLRCCQHFAQGILILGIARFAVRIKTESN
jgi:hypothetical protein